MCIHREHRTGNCRECDPYFQRLAAAEQKAMAAIDRIAESMPQLGDGDNA